MPDWTKDNKTGQYIYNKPEPKLITKMTSYLETNKEKLINQLKQDYIQRIHSLRKQRISDSVFRQKQLILQRNFTNNLNKIRDNYQQQLQPYQQVQQMVDQGQIDAGQAYEAMARLNLPADAERAIFRKPEAATKPGKEREPITPGQLLKYQEQINQMAEGELEKQWGTLESRFGSWAPGWGRKVPEGITKNMYLRFTDYAGYGQLNPDEQRQIDTVFDRMMQSKSNIEWDPSDPDVQKIRQSMRGGRLSQAAAKSEKINKSPLVENLLKRKSTGEPSKQVNDPLGIL